MMDVVYLVITVAFFGLMIAYGYACRALGREAATDAPKQ